MPNGNYWPSAASTQKEAIRLSPSRRTSHPALADSEVHRSISVILTRESDQLSGSPANSEYSSQIVQRSYPCAVVEDGRVQILLRPTQVVAKQAFEDLT